eukprot:CAMPEP_0206140430 /NCGR_PEP_ID=MMETSP1473-20131121/9441_1 /ASSEMBLY_ACC=CAM_ASM_001109 /TAXON_ID=1461547 /ORGANISM="Stichococcus sp, Strain RCC1054" /LENGTH=47 /DNA_ID= /DNA_START= /DNA_END= /DNA_ORIENTATION=
MVRTSHGKRVLGGEQSKGLRELFFAYKSAGKPGVTELVDALLALATR